MYTKALLNYIRTKLDNGASLAQTKQVILADKSDGWTERDVDEAFKVYESEK